MNSIIKKRKFKPRINSKNKSYALEDSPLYNLTTKKRLTELLGKSCSDLNVLSEKSNYRIFYLTKNEKSREIQSPDYDLDVVQTRIASLLVRVSVPDYLHSGIKGRSNITNAKVHVGDHPVLTLDIQKFYPSVSKKSIFHFFQKKMNASPDVAGILAELCSYDDHIPTGSRISMPLSFWASHALYSRLHSLCLSKGIKMSVFVDDLTFSGENVNNHFKNSVIGIIESAGYTVHPEKTNLYNHETPKLITGVIVNHSGIKVRNRHHKAIYTLFLDLTECTNKEQFESLHKKLIGRLNAAGQIESKFKANAIRLLHEKKKT
jgi:hypothetical protein